MARKVKAGSTPPPAAEQAPLSTVPLLDQIRGHEAQAQILLDAISRSRLASTLLFTGPAGIGKRRVALGLAQCLVCERATVESPKACGICGACMRVARGQSESLLVLEPQGAGIKIEQAQEVLQFIALRQLGRGRVVIINEAHLLNPQAGNALLKSLEEPPPGTHFILVTNLSGAVLTTIRSRSQTIRFQSLSDDTVRALTGADDWIVRAAQGSLETASRLSEGAEEWTALRRLAFSILEDMVQGRSPEALPDLKEQIKERPNALFIAQVWGRALRDFAVSSALGNQADKAKLLNPDQTRLIQEGGRLPLEWVEQLGDMCLQLESDINRNVDKTLAFENFCLSATGAYGAGREPSPVLG